MYVCMYVSIYEGLMEWGIVILSTDKQAVDMHVEKQYSFPLFLL
jgi:hypothetical protein